MSTIKTLLLLAGGAFVLAQIGKSGKISGNAPSTAPLDENVINPDGSPAQPNNTNNTEIDKPLMPGKKTGTVKQKSILFIGDSNTFLPFSYAHQIEAARKNFKVKIISKIGSQTSWMLTQLKQELAISKYDYVCILGGSNDIWSIIDPKLPAKHLSNMWVLATDQGSKVIAITPPNKNFYKRRTKAKLKALDSLISWMKQLSLPNTSLINFWQMTNDIKFFTSKDNYLHAQSNAHTLLAKEVLAIIDNEKPLNGFSGTLTDLIS